MNTFPSFSRNRIVAPSKVLPIALVAFALAFCLLFLGTENTKAQILVVNKTTGAIAQYNFDGSLVNASLISGLTNPQGLAVSGSSLLVSLGSANKISQYDLATGGLLNASFITGLNNPGLMSVTGSTLYVENIYGSNSVSTYNASTGAVITAGLVKTGSFPTGLSVSNNAIFTASSGTKTVGKYNLDGSAVNASLVTYSTGSLQNVLAYGSFLYVLAGTKIDKFTLDGTLVTQNFIANGVNGAVLNGAQGMAVLNGNLLVANASNSANAVGLYNLETGATINSAFISGFSAGDIIVVPEPSTVSLAILAGASFWLVLRRRKVDLFGRAAKEE